MKVNKKYNLLALCIIALIYFFTSNESTVGQSPTRTVSEKTAVRSIDIPHWSKTSPAINLKHIFLGEINRKGRPTGFHARPNGNDPSTSRLKSIKSKPNKSGIYTAQIEVYDTGDNQWKGKFSSFFPSSFDRDEVINAVLNAYKNRDKNKNQPWSGPSGQGFVIQGYLNRDGDINTAFPVYRRN